MGLPRNRVGAVHEGRKALADCVKRGVRDWVDYLTA
jgi:hypothetical protein